MAHIKWVRKGARWTQEGNPYEVEARDVSPWQKAVVVHPNGVDEGCVNVLEAQVLAQKYNRRTNDA